MWENATQMAILSFGGHFSTLYFKIFGPEAISKDASN